MAQFTTALTIAGHDSDGSAGMPADLHTFFTAGVYGMGLLTAAVSGNSYGITQQQLMPTDFIAEQFRVLNDDFTVRAAKTGMLGTAEIIKTVAEQLKQVDFGPLVVDPVIITKHGAMLLAEDAYQAFRDLLVPLATVITPNFFEAQKLAEMEIKTDDDMVVAAQKLQALGAKHVVIKGKHEPGWHGAVRDLLLLADGTKVWLSDPYIETDRINGTGDSYSALITAELAKGTDVKTAVMKAKRYVHAAIANELELGHKYGPINHWAASDTLK
nr:bifunctional hydroxymethylpyrimidine kinase/phosphomethylpyrimidine kinase [Limosilactobacillus equigenerosi]